ncbi:hypothetical protein ONZ45_g6715 [Pleurotus djamor]|nr:hypothetical protein ONZ45_g6715 [Pleurotus djamor]
MRANASTVLEGPNVVLVPYERHHVPKYHEWMQSAELRELTASEPLSLNEEYEMQRKWREDEDKLTFIILARPPSVSTGLTTQDPVLYTMTMIGDVNLFLKGAQSSDGTQNDEEDSFEAEVEIMIAEQDFRRKGLALETLQLMLGYATGSSTGTFPPPSSSTLTSGQTPACLPPLPVPASSLVTRISEFNTPSIKLFEKLGFAVTKHVAVFQEVEMHYQGQAVEESTL